MSDHNVRPFALDLDELLARLHVVSLPLRTRFRGVTSRECVLIEGPTGWGEFSPFLEYPPQEARHWLDAALEAAFATLPTPIRERIPVNATLPAISASEVPTVLRRYDGCTTVKVKVGEKGQSLRDDISRVDAVREILGDSGGVRIDANGAWSVYEAIEAITALSRDGVLEYVEQPCESIEELAQVRSHFAGEVLIAADESIRKSEDPFRVREAQAADIAVLKVAPLGGVQRALAIAAQIEMPVVVSSELSSSVGLGIASILAGALPDLPYACGLGTADLLAGDVANEPLSAVGGTIPVGRIGADAQLLAEHAASSARVSWWRERVIACWKVA